MIASISSRMLLAFIGAADLAIFAGGAWLERFSLAAAADPKSSAMLILMLLLANLALFALLLGAAAAGALGLSRLTQTIYRVFADIRHRNVYGDTRDARPERNPRVLAAERRAPRRL